MNDIVSINTWRVIFYLQKSSPNYNPPKFRTIKKMNEEGNKFNSKTDFSFGGEPYTVYFTTPDTDNLMLTIEHRISCDRWCGRYSSQRK